MTVKELASNPMSDNKNIFCPVRKREFNLEKLRKKMSDLKLTKQESHEYATQKYREGFNEGIMAAIRSLEEETVGVNLYCRWDAIKAKLESMKKVSINSGQ